MTTSDSVPRKCCTKCGKEYPATLEHFSVHDHNRDGLHSWCKACKYVANQQWYWNNLERERERSRKYQMANRARTREYDRQVRRANPEKNRAKVQSRAARKRALVATFTPEQWQECLNYFYGCCAYCGKQRDFWNTLQQDHFIALSANGTYTADNIVPACRSCNAKKQDIPAAEWLSRNFKPHKVKQILARIEGYFEWVRHS